MIGMCRIQRSARSWQLAIFVVVMVGFGPTEGVISILVDSIFLNSPALNPAGLNSRPLGACVWAAQPSDAAPVLAYTHDRRRRADATLRGVAFAPQGDGKPAIGIACGDHGAILRSEDGGRHWSEVESGVVATLYDVVWLDAQRVIVVGGTYDRITNIGRGVVLTSRDGGQSWIRQTGNDLPVLRRLSVNPDRRGVSVLGDWSYVWLSRSFESRDGGVTWQPWSASPDRMERPLQPSVDEFAKWSSAIGVPVPIRDACRVPDIGLCAVGDHGTIYLTRNTDRSWECVLGDDRRAGILLIAEQPDTVPWSWVGSETLEHGHRVGLLLRHVPHVQRSQRLRRLSIVEQVAVKLGASGADLLGDGQPDEVAKQWLTVQRPAVVVLDERLPTPWRDAFVKAATDSGIPTVATVGFADRGSVTIHHQALLPKTGVLASDLQADAMHWIDPIYDPPSSVALRYVYDTSTQNRHRDTLLDAQSTSPAMRLTPIGTQASRRRLQTAHARIKQHDHLVDAMRTLNPNQLIESFQSLLDQTPVEDRFRLAWSVYLESVRASTVNRSTRSDADWIALQHGILLELADRFGNASVGRWANARHQSNMHSMEWRRLRDAMANAPASTQITRPAESVPVSPFQITSSGVRQVSAVSPIVVPKPEQYRVGGQDHSDGEPEVDLRWDFHPLVLIANDAARRRNDDGTLQSDAGESANLQRLIQLRDPTIDPEGWAGIVRRSGPKIIRARRAQRPPRLDSRLTDPCWGTALGQAGVKRSIQFAYDDHYVYIAVRGPASEIDTDSTPMQSGESARDQDLTDVDRLRIRIDTDRDIATAYQLQVSLAGRTHDDVDGHPLWQPTWYVDAQVRANHTVFEIAIARRDLVDLPLTAGESWFVAVDILKAGHRVKNPVMPDPKQWVRVAFR